MNPCALIGMDDPMHFWPRDRKVIPGVIVSMSLLTHRYRAVIVLITFVCLTSISSNYIIINFTFICMQQEHGNTVTFAHTRPLQNGTDDSQPCLFSYREVLHNVGGGSRVPVGHLPLQLFLHYIWSQVSPPPPFNLSLKVSLLCGWDDLCLLHCSHALGRRLRALLSPLPTPPPGDILKNKPTLSLGCGVLGRLLGHRSGLCQVGPPPRDVPLHRPPHNVHHRSQQSDQFDQRLRLFFFLAFYLQFQLCESRFGWRSAFYLHAAFGLIVFLLWLKLYSDEPGQSNRVSEKELRVIGKGKSEQHKEGTKTIPYKVISPCWR